MILIKRGVCPADLAELPSAATGDHYNKPGVVHALWEMQHGKCCYCERKLPEKGHLKAVEHFAAKAIFKGLRNEWTNLLLACAQCNGKKSDKFPVILSSQENEDKVVYLKQEQAAEAAIIDPSVVDPEKHLAYDFSAELKYGIVMAKDGSVLGTQTIATVGLHAKFYSDLRWSHYTKILNVHLINLLEAVHEEDELAIAGEKTRFGRLMAPQTEFAGFARAFARHKGLYEQPVDLKIPS